MKDIIGIVAFSLTLNSCEAKAAEGLTKGPRLLFLDKAGQAVSLETAFHASAKGETVYRCQPVKATVSKNGGSISFKVVK